MIEKFALRDSNSKLIQFLMKLNDEYESVRSQILAMDPPPTDKAYYIIQQIEKQKQVTNHTFKPTAFFENMNNRNANKEGRIIEEIEMKLGMKTKMILRKFVLIVIKRFICLSNALKGLVFLIGIKGKELKRTTLVA